MSTRQTKWSTILIVLLSLSSITNAQSVKKVAQAKMQFLKLGVGARAAAMGDAVLALKISGLVCRYRTLLMFRCLSHFGLVQQLI